MSAKNTPNPLLYTLPMKANKPGRLHRATCKHIPSAAEIVSPAEVAPEVVAGASRATCCSVRELDREAAVQEARNAEMNIDYSNGGGEDCDHGGIECDGECQCRCPGCDGTNNDIEDSEADADATPGTEADITAIGLHMAGQAFPTIRHAVQDDADRMAKAENPKQRGKRGTRTFDAANVAGYRCAGACGEFKKVTAFPTVTGTAKRGVECRTCRDARKAAK